MESNAFENQSRHKRGKDDNLRDKIGNDSTGSTHGIDRRRITINKYYRSVDIFW